jgi:hypothetical protein
MRMSADRVRPDRVRGDGADCGCKRLRICPIARTAGPPGRPQPGVLARHAPAGRTARSRITKIVATSTPDGGSGSVSSSPEPTMIRSTRPLRSSRSIILPPAHSKSNCGTGSGCGHLPDSRMRSPALAEKPTGVSRWQTAAATPRGRMPIAMNSGNRPPSQAPAASRCRHSDAISSAPRPAQARRNLRLCATPGTGHSTGRWPDRCCRSTR